MQKSTDIVEAGAQQGGRRLRSKSEDHKCSSAALLFATAQPSGPNLRCAQASARGLIFGSQKGERAGAGEGIQAHVVADAGILQQLWRIECSEFRRRKSIPAPERILLARWEWAYCAIGVIVGRFVPHITVRTAKAPPSVDSTDRISRCMRERA